MVLSRVVLYTRDRCPLCDQAKAQLDSLGLTFSTRDVTADTGLLQEFGSRVPVIEVDGVEVFDGGISASELAVIMREAGVIGGL